MIKNIFRYAKKEHFIRKNPLSIWRFGDEYDNSRRNVEHHQKIVSPELLGKFLKDLADSKIGVRRKILIYFGLGTGLRSMNIVGENGIKWKDIDFEKKYIFFEKSRMKGEKRTEKSRQDFILPLSDTMISLLLELKKLNKPNKNDRVFENIADSTINQILKRIAGITKHGLRGTLKTFATKNLKNHKTPNFIIEMYLYHAPSMSEVEMAYSELLYKDPEIQAQLCDFAEWWDQYLLSLFNFKKALLGGEDEL
jgi:prophage CP4-57-like integrase